MLSTWRRFLPKSHEHGSDSEDSHSHVLPEIEMNINLQTSRSLSFDDYQSQSFSMEDEEDTTGPAQPQQYNKYTSAPPNGLVHRRTKHHDDSEHNDNDDDYDYDSHNHLSLNLNLNLPKARSQSRSQSQSLLPRGRRHRHKHKNLNLYIRYCLSLALGLYLALLFKSSVWLAHSKNGDAYSGARQYLSVNSIFQSRYLQHQSTKRKESQKKLLQQRAQQRRLETRPKSTVPSASLYISWYSIATLTESSPSTSPPPKSSASTTTPASLDQLCGFHAQNDSLTHPDSYPATQALDANARVLITGILSPLGMALALQLATNCGVQIMAGVDSMYPNTLANRLELSQRMKLLTTNIPKLFKPLILSHIGLDPKYDDSKKGGDSKRLSTTGELDLIATFKPTHVIHLAHAQPIRNTDDTASHPHYTNTHSPYIPEDGSYNPPLYALHQSMVAMEQILQSLAETHTHDAPPISFVYASSLLSSLEEENDDDKVHHACKIMDEIMASTYHSVKGVSSSMVALRLPNAVYGPFSQRSSVVDELLDQAMPYWNTQHNVTTTTTESSSFQFPSTFSSLLYPKTTTLDLVYVSDAVDSMIAALQYQAWQPLAIPISSGAETSVASVSATIQSLLPASTNITANSNNNTNKPLASNLLETLQQQQRALLDGFHWSPKTSLLDGMLQTMAWRLDQAHPYGRSKETGDAFLKRNNHVTCAPNDLTCHMNMDYLPCLSECNIKEQCLPSVFDKVHPLMVQITEGCDIVLFTQSLGYNVQDLNLKAEYMDEITLKDDDILICNLAVIPRDSDLTKMVVNKVPNDQLAKFGIVPQSTDVGHTVHERRLDGLNGRLLYHGWILIWIEHAIEPLSVTDKSLLKLSPGKFFHPDVQHALFVEENFAVSPNIEDVEFLVGEMTRASFPKRSVKRDMVKEDGVTHHTVKLRLPPEPKRRAAILFAPLRYPNIPDDPLIEQYMLHHDKKLTIHDATKFMRYEIDEGPSEKEPPGIRLQRVFYERIPTYLNRQELRSNMEPLYLYSMRHWVRTRWVVHDLSLEESRLLRCDWYQEHSQWKNVVSDLDQLSFAHVMARREVKRRMAYDEPDDHYDTFLEEHPELKDLTDLYEWHALETMDASQVIYREPTNWLSTLPDHIKDEEALEQEQHEIPTTTDAAALFVRIMSEKMMAVSRKVWSRNHERNQKHKTVKKEIEE
jgi:nucleoside-diphosphate-sugar epimerase